MSAVEKEQVKAVTEFQRPPETSSSLSPLVQAAMNGSLDTDKLKQLLEIQREYERGEAEKAFHMALSEFKKHNLTLYRDKKVSFTNKSGGKTEYRHTTLGAALAEINPLLGLHQLSLTWETHQEGQKITVKCVLAHALGHSKATSLSASPDDSGGKNSIQAVGSTVSYLERYTAFSLLGVASMDQDDDGKGADDKKAPEPPPGYDEWEADLVAVADDGLEALEKAFRGAKIEYRKYITANKPDEWAAIKKKARGQ